MIFVATNDLAAHTRGRAAPISAEESVRNAGVGWVPANLAIHALGEISSGNVFGSTGDLRLLPDPQARFDLPASGELAPLRIYLADQVTPDGGRWGGCPRTFARKALEDLEREHALVVDSTFEHEFMMSTGVQTGPFSLARLRSAEPLGSRLLDLLDEVGLDPETWLPEYGEDQFEVTIAPARGIAAADRAIILRDLVHELARQLGRRASFAPVLSPTGGGNGVHVHLSLQDARTGQPALPSDDDPRVLSEVGRRFAGGILAHAPALLALTAPSPTSYLRLKPHRWSAGGVFLADRNREALVRVCPVSELSSTSAARQLNLEFRAADATANAWIVLGALVRAGLSGLSGDAEPPQVYPESMTDDELGSVPQLPGSLEESLAALRADETVASWFEPPLWETLLLVRETELAAMAGLSEEERCRAVADRY